MRPYDLRPDLSGVIVMTDQLQWQGEDVIVAVEHKQNAHGFNGEFNLRTIGPEAFKEVMVTYFATKGFVTTTSSTQRVLEHAEL